MLIYDSIRKNYDDYLKYKYLGIKNTRKAANDEKQKGGAKAIAKEKSVL